MKNIILGNSLVKRMRVRGVETISIKGLNMESAAIYMQENKEYFRGALVFIIVGPLRFTKMRKKRREVVFCKPTRTINSLFAPFYENVTRLNIEPIVCPVFPMDFRRYNTEKCPKPIEQGWYDEWSKKIIGHSVIENKAIYKFNKRRGHITPSIHRRIFHRKKDHYVYRVSKTTDGLHITSEIRREWEEEINRVLKKMDR